MDKFGRITKLLPRSPLVLSLLFLAGCAILGGLEAAYYYMPALAAQTTDGRIETFDLDSEGSLAVWFSSATLSLCAAVAYLVYSVRKHKADDYHGRYRIWLWAAACWLVMSIDETASLHEGFKELMTLATGQRIYGDGSLWWVLGYGLVLGVIGTRLLLEMRSCRTSTLFLGLAGAAYGTAVVAQLEFLLPQSGARGVMLEEGCEMLGNLLLLLSMTVHARYVVLLAEGEIEERAPRKAKKAASEKPAVQAAAAAVPAAEKPAAAEPTAKRAAAEIAAAAPKAQAAANPGRRWWWPFGGSKAGEAKAAAAPPKKSATAPPRETAKPAGQAQLRSASGDALRVDGPQDGPQQPHHKLSRAERKALRRAQRQRGDYEDEDDE